jgi:glycosyltransferase involved in cell wall biosynthesis
VNLGVDPAKVKVVPNGLDDVYLAQLVDGSDADAVPRTGKTVLYCGRLSPEKDPLYLMEAARLLLANRPDVRLKFVGDGPLRPRIEELAAAWNIADRLTLVGEVPHDQIAQHMRQADVLCLSSVREGYPNVLLEALACGLPIVATNVGGVPEIVTDENVGILVPTGQPRELAQALDTALRKQWDRQSLQQVVRGRSWHDVAREMLDFVERTIP